jgi:hypothetical protein
MTKHPKTRKPSDIDLMRNPLIGGSKGVTMGQATPEDLEQLEGRNTIEGDRENDVNAQGGVDDPGRRITRSRSKPDHGGRSRRVPSQGRKTHEQQLRILERKPDYPDERQVGQEIARSQDRGKARLPNRKARQSEFAISRGGLNQESQHNKHRAGRATRGDKA